MCVIPIRRVNCESSGVLGMVFFIHWNSNISLVKFSPLAAPEVVKMTTFVEASDENFVKRTIFLFQGNDVGNFWGLILYLFYQVTWKPSEPMAEDLTCTYVTSSLVEPYNFHVSWYIRKGTDDMHGRGGHIVNKWSISEFLKFSQRDPTLRWSVDFPHKGPGMEKISSFNAFSRKYHLDTVQCDRLGQWYVNEETQSRYMEQKSRSRTRYDVWRPFWIEQTHGNYWHIQR